MSVRVRIAPKVGRPVVTDIPDPTAEEVAEVITALTDHRPSSLDEPTAMRVTIYLIVTGKLKISPGLDG